jgi:acetolactate synthase small subunit
LFRILGAFQQRAFGSSTLIAMKIAKKLENRATVFTQSGSQVAGHSIRKQS